VAIHKQTLLGGDRLVRRFSSLVGDPLLSQTRQQQTFHRTTISIQCASLPPLLDAVRWSADQEKLAENKRSAVPQGQQTLSSPPFSSRNPPKRPPPQRAINNIVAKPEIVHLFFVLKLTMKN